MINQSCISCLVLCAIIHAAFSDIVNRTSGDEFRSYFNTVIDEEFQYDSIICTTVFCQVTCGTSFGCEYAIIDASASETLVLDCTQNQACRWAEIIAPTTNMLISCPAEGACFQQIVTIESTPNVTFECTGMASCKYSTYYLTDVEAELSFKMECNDTLEHMSCQLINIYMPYGEFPGLNVSCDTNSDCLNTYTLSCTDIGTLDMQCPSRVALWNVSSIDCVPGAICQVIHFSAVSVISILT